MALTSWSLSKDCCPSPRHFHCSPIWQQLQQLTHQRVARHRLHSPSPCAVSRCHSANLMLSLCRLAAGRGSVPATLLHGLAPCQVIASDALAWRSLPYPLLIQSWRRFWTHARWQSARGCTLISQAHLSLSPFQAGFPCSLPRVNKAGYSATFSKGNVVTHASKFKLLLLVPSVY